MKEKKIYIIGLSVLVAVAVFAVVVIVIMGRGMSNLNVAEQAPDKSVIEGESIDIFSDQGIDMDIGEDGPTIFARYRFLDSATEKNINVSSENAKLFVRTPGGEEEEMTSDRHFYPLRIYPAQESGEYYFRIELNNGEVYEETFNSLSSQEVELTPAEDVSEARTDDRGYALQAFNPGEIDVANVDFVRHIDQSWNISDLPMFDEEYIWLPVEGEAGEHIFLIKEGEKWHYVVKSFDHVDDTEL